MAVLARFLGSNREVYISSVLLDTTEFGIFVWDSVMECAILDVGVLGPDLARREGERNWLEREPGGNVPNVQ